MSSNKVRITFKPLNLTIDVAPGTTLLEAARLANINLAAPCGGTGKCGQCRVWVTSTGEKSPERFELACQTRAYHPVTVKVSGEQLTILEEGHTRDIILEPAVLPGKGIALVHRAGVSLENRIDGEEAPLGMAVDVGTTTIVAYLYDLLTGKRLSVVSVVNGQRAYGADVISRLAYAVKDPGHYREVRQAVIESLNRLFMECCIQGGVTPRSVREIVMVGNTPMMHMVLNLPVEELAAAPFQPVHRGPFYLFAKELGFHPVDRAVCYFPPFIGGFVGSDALAAALAHGFGNHHQIRLLVDIGTNGEILLQAGERLLAASAPAGPALEGGNIACGKIAEPGAIRGVVMDYDVHLEVIGGVEPTGVCGSALVDAVAEMLRLGIIEDNGSMVNRGQLPPITSFTIKNRVITGDGNRNRFMLTGSIYLGQKDIREIQLAKGAVAAGIQVVMDEAGVEAEKLDSLLLAGGFGNYLNPANALRIGLLGFSCISKIKQVGNAAGAGAAVILLSYSEREVAEKLSKRFKHLELANDHRYQEQFIRQLNFPDKECMV